MTPRATIIFATVVVAVVWAAIELAVLIRKKSRWPKRGYQQHRSYFTDCKRMYMPEDE